jgi:hypothetical protein
MFVVWIPIALFELLVLALSVKVGLAYARTPRIVYLLFPADLIFPLLDP